MRAGESMKMILWFGLAAGLVAIIGGMLGIRLLIAVGSFGLLLAFISAAFSAGTRQH